MSHVLIDNDAMIRRAWEIQAKWRGNAVRTFASYDAFSVDSEQIDSLTLIYIDSDAVVVALTQTPEPQRDSLMAASRQLITPNMLAYDRSYVIRALACVSNSERLNVADCARRLRAAEMEGYYSDVIDALAHVPVATERQRSTASARQFINPAWTATGVPVLSAP